jgi:hypothetical protein
MVHGDNPINYGLNSQHWRPAFFFIDNGHAGHSRNAARNGGFQPP